MSDDWEAQFEDDELSGKGVVINVTDTLRVRNDGLRCWAIESRELKPAGTVVAHGRYVGKTYEQDTYTKWADARYYPTLQKAVNVLLNASLLDNGFVLADDLKTGAVELQAAIKTATDRLVAALC